MTGDPPRVLPEKYFTVDTFRLVDGPIPGQIGCREEISERVAHLETRNPGPAMLGQRQTRENVDVAAPSRRREEEEVAERFLPKMPVRVLLVEGDDSTRRIIAAHLRKCSYRGSSPL
ncbi:hypothetical protein B296_00023512 [Ensete ventricosum]|uniref:Response regulatory domain-containing protein n=1 Tax=Ensete ventricosum TaxID=4639 RepID=A0A426ZVD6_ENSVE|nr:hypothetical protein B296_00023512 [Ensete ventricosum]